ncbi:unnamed protein product [Lymnaea stagnalis]|uniref:Uncharacterized protein n=1 Tax=Lymnaea stagnalis TaxID=6523 RepID=A0AAV2I7S9_LYMST
MPDYTVRALPPRLDPPRQPVYSARLDVHTKLRRVDSTDSLVTQLSLFSCSSYGKSAPSPRPRRRQRKKVKPDSGELKQTSVWVELASRRRGAFDKLLKIHEMHAQLEAETDIFRCLPDDEKLLVVDAGRRKVILPASGRQRCNSEPCVLDGVSVRKPQRIKSAGGHHDGSSMDWKEIWRRHVEKKRYGLRRLAARATHKPIVSEQSSAPRDALFPEDMERHKDIKSKHVSIWMEDSSKPTDSDVGREFSAKVKSEIKSTTNALKKMTGHISPRPLSGTLTDNPHLVKANYNRWVMFPHRMKISPHLSKVIQADVKVRMGRPRYHEIRIRDLHLWNEGHALDRAHRNLKVFNWLHSLKESEFEMLISEATFDDTLPGSDEPVKDEVVVSVDEPKLKPLF